MLIFPTIITFRACFTVNEVNVTIQAKVDEKQIQKEKASTAFSEAGEAKTKKAAALQRHWSGSSRSVGRKPQTCESRVQKENTNEPDAKEILCRRGTRSKDAQRT